MKNDQDRRALNQYELRIINKLLEADFQGKDEIRGQLKHTRAKPIPDEDKCGSIRLFTTSKKRAEVSSRIPVEASVRDLDGELIEILLHVVDGMVDELEIIKYGQGELVKEINPENMLVRTNDSVITE